MKETKKERDEGRKDDERKNERIKEE